MVVGEMPEGLDLVVVGAGPGGYTAALEAAALGRSVTVIDQAGADGIGGTCLLAGCIPSKALIEIASLGSRSLDFAGGALGINAINVDMAAFQTWKRTMVTSLSTGISNKFRAAEIDVVQGIFYFTGPTRGVIELAGDSPPKHIEFNDAVIASGSSAVELPALPFDGNLVLDAAGILDLNVVPDQLVVVGGGYIGIEIGTALRKLGSSVVVIEATDRILPELPPVAAKHVSRRAEKLGIEVLTRHSATSIGENTVVARGETGEERTIPADAVLVSVGRRPATKELGLAAAGIDVDSAGLIPVDDANRATPHIAAVGDVIAGPALAHKAIAEAKVAARALCGKPAGTISSVVPLVVFSDPEVAVAGYDQAAAEAAGIETELLRLPFGASGRAATMESTTGSVELVVDTESRAIVGGVLVGPHVSELIGEIVLAIEMAATPDDLALSIHPHPTLSEMVQDTADLHSGRTQ